MSGKLTLKNILAPEATHPSIFNNTCSTIGYRGKKAQYKSKVKKYHGSKGSLSAYMQKRKKHRSHRIHPRPIYQKVVKNKGRIEDYLTRELVMPANDCVRSMYQSHYSSTGRLHDIRPRSKHANHPDLRLNKGARKMLYPTLQNIYGSVDKPTNNKFPVSPMIILMN